MASTTLKRSFLGPDDKIVLDMGTALWKVGYTGESAPRLILKVSRSNKTRHLNIDINNYKEDELSLFRAIRKIFRLLVVDSKKVIICDSILSSITFKTALCKVLFSLNVPCISFFPSPWLALFACGRSSGLVIDVGEIDVTVAPVYYNL